LRVGRIFVNLGYIKSEKQKMMTKKKNTTEHEKEHNSKTKQQTNEDISVPDNGTKTEIITNHGDTAEQKVTGEEEKKEVTADEKLAEMLDKYIRLSAEFDNYRKRTLREKIEITRSAGEDLLKNLIPVIDDFERALKLMGPTQDSVAMKSGIELIYNKFLSFLKQHGVKEIEALDKDFNVDLHEAVTKIPAPDENMKGKVIDVIEKGYYLNDKIIRFSKVVVGE
jgi:molecular chaperone GrpE